MSLICQECISIDKFHFVSKKRYYMKKDDMEIIGGGLFSTVIEIDESRMVEPLQLDIDIVERKKSYNA